MGSAVETLCGQAYGAGKYEMLGIYMQRSVILLSATGVPLFFIYIFSKQILLLLGESPAVASAAALFVYGLIPQIFAYAANFAIQKFLQAQSIVNPSAYISAGTLVVHVVLTWVALYVLGWGLLGGALVLSLSWWIIHRLLPDPEVALDSLAICGTILGWVFMVSVGFNAAVSVRVSNEVGAGHPKSAAFSVVVITGISTMVALIFAVITIVLRDQMSYVFTPGIIVSNAVSDLAPLLAISVILNGIQPVLSGVAVGCGWQAFVAYVNVGCYYVVGIPFGCILGFTFNLGAKGIWSGMLGGTVIQTIILIWVTLRTDWNKEVENARNRMDKWNDSKDELFIQ